VLGGVPYGRGALFHLLRNQLYLGHIVHKGTVHPGAHSAIIEQALFDTVQVRLDEQRRRRQAQPERRMMRAPLAGRLFDAAGDAMSPTFSRGARGTSYRYYVSSSLQRGQATSTTETDLRRISAPAIEQLVTALVTRVLPQSPDPLREVRAVHLRACGLEIVLPGRAHRIVGTYLEAGEVSRRAGAYSVVTVPLELPLRGGRTQISSGARHGPAPDAVLIAALRRAHAMTERDPSGRPMLTAAPASVYDRKILRLAFLAPEIQVDILAGRQPPGFRLEAFMRTEIPLNWHEQRAALGWLATPSS
jgi:hypothetical protein